MRATLHLVLHVVVPGLVGWLAFRPRWLRAWAILVATMLVDVDHVLASPHYDPNRCSLGFHPLHTAPALALYALAAAWRPTRLVGVGLLLHMALDGLDCVWMAG